MSIKDENEILVIGNNNNTNLLLNSIESIITEKKDDETNKKNIPKWANKAYETTAIINRTSKLTFEEINQNFPGLLGPDNQIYVKFRYTFSKDGKKLLRRAGNSFNGFKEAQENWDIAPIVEFEIINDELIGLNEGVYYGNRILTGYPGGIVVQTKYRNNGFYFTDNFKKLHFRLDSNAKFPEFKGMPEFWYDSLYSTSLIAKNLENFDEWIPDPVNFALDDENGNRIPLILDQVDISEEETYEYLVKKYKPLTMSPDPILDFSNSPVPRANTPAGGFTSVPGPFLKDLKNPPTNSGPDLRGIWKTIGLIDKNNNFIKNDSYKGWQRIEQSGYRWTITSLPSSNGYLTVHDGVANDFETGAVRDLNAQTLIPFVALSKYSLNNKGFKTHMIKPLEPFEGDYNISVERYIQILDNTRYMIFKYPKQEILISFFQNTLDREFNSDDFFTFVNEKISDENISSTEFTNLIINNNLKLP